MALGGGFGGGGLAGVARIAFESVGAGAQDTIRDSELVERQYRESTAGMSDAAIKLELSQDKLQRALRKGPAAYREQARAELQALRDRLKLATAGIPVKPRAPEREHGLGEIRVDRLDVRTIAAWRRRLPDGSAWHAHKALRQVLAYAVRAKLVSENVAKLVPNPEPKRREALTFGTWEDLERLAEELPAERRSLPIVVAGTGLRPEEWLALERRDVDAKAGVLHVRRVYTDGRVRDTGSSRARSGAFRCVSGPLRPCERIPGVWIRRSSFQAREAGI
jgi:integrase